MQTTSHNDMSIQEEINPMKLYTKTTKRYTQAENLRL